MAKRIVIDNALAIKIANLYSDPNYCITEKSICADLDISKAYFRRALDKVIILGIIDIATVNAIAKKADKNHNTKLKELGFNKSDKIKIFYDSLIERRKEYLSLKFEAKKMEDFFAEISLLEKEIETAKFQEETHLDFVSSEDDGFVPKNSEALLEELNHLKGYYDYTLEEYNRIILKIEEIEKSVS